ncbi:helix-turn-helix domain-containing protein [Polaribacter sp.]|uniref:helix-turn-helix domain-containing protein n=1 Tax=Polaribacter sp. TaxID=1920175 RepID=UPI003BB119D6
MIQSTLIQISPIELANFISSEIKMELLKFAANPKVKYLNLTNKPHLTRKETAKFFDVSLNCINDWCNRGILKPFKVGQRTYFMKSHLLIVLFGKEDKQENQDQ